jgi:hypothetical protein
MRSIRITRRGEAYEPIQPFLKSRRDCAEMVTRIARYAAGDGNIDVILQREACLDYEVSKVDPRTCY